MPHYNIEQGVEIPDYRVSGESKNQDLIDLLLKMNINESFSYPRTKLSAMESAILVIKRRNLGPGKKWSKRKEDAVTMRIWRVQ